MSTRPIISLSVSDTQRVSASLIDATPQNIECMKIVQDITLYRAYIAHVMFENMQLINSHCTNDLSNLCSPFY